MIPTLTGPQLFLLFVPFLTAMIVVFLSHPVFVKLSKRHNALDNPNWRKKHTKPIPLLGGPTIFMGFVAGMLASDAVLDCSPLFVSVNALFFVLYIGLLDDLVGLRVGVRLLLETIVAAILIYLEGTLINNFDGMWGIYQIPLWLSIPITIVACVGIINAINLIDGVDGLSSGFAIWACGIFGCIFFLSNDLVSLMLAVVMIGSMLPFFIHNLFGEKSKMFLGDGGALVVGLLLSLFVVRVMKFGNPTSEMDPNIGFAALTLAIMSHPVFDTLRVMFSRIFRGRPPFAPDRTHLHHAFLGNRFSHYGTTLSILFICLLNLVAWWISYRLLLSDEGQLYVVVAVALVNNVGVYWVLTKCRAKKVRRLIIRLAYLSHPSKSGFYQSIRSLVDR